MNKIKLKKIANKIRKNIITSIYFAKSGHPGGSLSSVDLLTYLYFYEMNIDFKNPNDINRDRFILSKGHSAPCLYSTLAQKGYFSLKNLKTLRHINSYLQGHPETKYIPGIDVSTGSLGHGISVAAGIALASKINHINYRVFTLLGDGELQEGQVWEAIMFVSSKKLNNFILIIDNNNLQIDDNIENICSPYPIDKKIEAFNFYVINVENGNNFDQLHNAFNEAKEIKNMPIAIIMNTIKGKGISFMENSIDWHGKAPNNIEYKIAINELEKEGKLLCQN